MSKFVLSPFLARKKGQEINRDWDKLIGFFRPPAAIKGSSKGAEFILTFALDKIEHVENAIWVPHYKLLASATTSRIGARNATATSMSLVEEFVLIRKVSGSCCIIGVRRWWCRTV